MFLDKSLFISVLCILSFITPYVEGLSDFNFLVKKKFHIEVVSPSFSLIQSPIFFFFGEWI